MGPNPGIPSLGDQLTQVPSSLDPSAGPVEAFCLLVLDPDQVMLFPSFIFVFVFDIL